MSSAGPTTPGATPASSPESSHDRVERRGLVIAGVVFFGALLALILVATVLNARAGDERTSSTGTTVACASDDAVCQAAQRSEDRPGIIPQPGSGRAPDEPSDRGGWEQVALFGAILLALALIAGLVVRSARRARAAASGSSPPPASTP
jgi:hypothetical protein